MALLAGLEAYKIRRAIRLRLHNIGASDTLCYNHRRSLSGEGMSYCDFDAFERTTFEGEKTLEIFVAPSALGERTLLRRDATRSMNAASVSQPRSSASAIRGSAA